MLGSLLLWLTGGYVMEDYGAGYNNDPSNPSKPVYFYLILDSKKTESLSKEDIQSFYRSGVNTGPEFVFVVTDLATDIRLKTDLQKHGSGHHLINDLEHHSPAFIISDAPLNHIEKADHVHFVKIERYDKDIEMIFEKMGLPKNSSRRLALKFLRRINAWSELKPNICGIGININALIQDAINKLEKSVP